MLIRHVLLLIAILLLLSAPFTAAAAASAGLNQCGNLANGNPTDCSWQNGNLNSNQAHWLEGDSVPYQLVFTGLTPNATYTVTIGYDTTKAGKHAIDYLTSYNRTMAGGAPAMTPTNGTASECSGVTGCTPSSPNTFAIPADPNVTAAGVTPIAGNFSVFNGTITAVNTPVRVSGTYTTDSETDITVTFTAGAANSGSTTNAVLAWGGHIATRQDWTQGLACVNISGSPFHMMLVSFSGGASGSQDRGLTASAVLFPATIKISKTAIPTSSAVFPFTITPALPTSAGSVTGFSLVNDGSSNNYVSYTLNTSAAFNVAYTFQEGSLSGWNLTGLSCTPDTVSGSTYSVNGSAVTITPQEGGVINCGYTNAFPAPTLSGVSPNTGVRGTSVPVTLTGANFLGAATVSVANAGVTVSNVI